MKKPLFAAIFLIVTAVLLTGCNPAKTPVPVTVIPLEIATATTEPPIQTTKATVFKVTPSRTPVFVFAPDEGEPVYPLADLRILSPGDGSRLISPIRPELSIVLGADNTIEVELLNSRGELLVKKVLRFPEVSSSQRILIRPEMDFEIAKDEEAGRLVVKTYDVFGRLTALTSCDLTLLSHGESKLEAARVPYELFLLTGPRAGEVIRGGVVTVSGYIRLISQSVVVIELVDENGAEISNRVISLPGDASSPPIVFSATLPYQVGRETAVRLILRQAKGNIPGPAFATSLLLSVR
jgi:hypothetical protein